MHVRSAGDSDIGRTRKVNEDSYLVAPDLGLYVIADGIGGQRAGDVASRLAVDTMEDYWRKVKNNEPPSFLEVIERDVSLGAKHLINSIFLANMIINAARKKHEYRGMGTTIAAVLVEKSAVWAANVGDSPVYLSGGGRLTQVSEDHSFEGEQKNRGAVDLFGSTNPMLKNVLTRALGLREGVDVYATPLEPEEGDLIMLCSDGLTNYVPEPSIKTVLDDFSLSVDRKVKILIDEANRGGGKDNISVILLEVVDEGTWHKFKKRFKTTH